MSNSNVDFYKVLEIDGKATPQQIREAYKKAALAHHPDRVPVDSPERPRRTRKFQQINDAYYTLSDPTRRRDYDAKRRFQQPFASSSNADDSFDADEEIPRQEQQQSSGGWGSGFPWSTFGFGGGNGNANAEGKKEEKFSKEQFGSVFEEMMREAGMAQGENSAPTGKFWSLLGGISGGAMGFIIANFPGAVAGAVAGNRLGAVRDTRGKSVYSVYQELPQGDKAKLLSNLAAKVFAHAVSG